MQTELFHVSIHKLDSLDGLQKPMESCSHRTDSQRVSSRKHLYIVILIHDAKSSNRCFQALDNFTVIPEALIITWLLDCGTCYAAHASHESFHSFYNLYSSYRGPTSLIRKTSLCTKHPSIDFPTHCQNPQSEAKAFLLEYGSDEDIDWNLSQMWAEELDRLEALRPARISWDAEAITISYLFAQDICPPYLLLQVAQKAEEVQLMYKEKGGEMIRMYLERWGY